MAMDLLMVIGVGVAFVSVPAMTILSILLIGETNEDLEPFSDWLIFSWATLPFRPETLSFVGLRYRKWYLRFLVAFIGSILLILTAAVFSAS